MCQRYVKITTNTANTHAVQRSSSFEVKEGSCFKISNRNFFISELFTSDFDWKMCDSGMVTELRAQRAVKYILVPECDSWVVSLQKVHDGVEHCRNVSCHS